jgi:hypothetical protein
VLNYYVNVEGEYSDGTFLPLDTTEIVLRSDVGTMAGNEWVIPKKIDFEKVTFTATSRANPRLNATKTLWIQKWKDPRDAPDYKDPQRKPSGADSRVIRKAPHIYQSDATNLRRNQRHRWPSCFIIIHNLEGIRIRQRHILRLEAAGPQQILALFLNDHKRRTVCFRLNLYEALINCPRQSALWLSEATIAGGKCQAILFAYRRAQLHPERICKPHLAHEVGDDKALLVIFLAEIQRPWLYQLQQAPTTCPTRGNALAGVHLPAPLPAGQSQKPAHLRTHQDKLLLPTEEITRRSPLLPATECRRQS